MSSLVPALYIVSLCAILVISGLSISGHVKSGLSFWPPAAPGTWQQHAFRFLFRIFFVGMIVLSWLDFRESQLTFTRMLIGVPMLVMGFGLAIYWSNFLGWRNAFGQPDGLKTSGIYRYSRNPIYVVSVFGMLGWGIIVQSGWVTSLLLLWALLYAGAPFLEEPWLEKQYGSAYREYKSRVPRFF